MTESTFADRISFHKELQVMEVDFSNMTLEVPEKVHAFYDELDRQLEGTRQKWLFLVNYFNARIMSEAWIAFAYRGKKANLAYSLGSVRFAASDDTTDAILDSAQRENFDPNLFSSRDKALAHLSRLRGEIPEDELAGRLVPTLPADNRSSAERIKFHPETEIMEVDYSDYTFATSSDVHAFYDETASQIAKTNRKWYFMVNYANTEILPEAWYTWAMRGKKLNMEYSLGTVRFGPQYVTKGDILKRARADEFNPNLVSTRDEALERITKMKQKTAA